MLRPPIDIQRLSRAKRSCAAAERLDRGGMEWGGRHRYRLHQSFSSYRGHIRHLQKERIAVEKETWALKIQHGGDYGPELHGPFQSKSFMPENSRALNVLDQHSTRRLSIEIMTGLIDTVIDGKHGDRDDPTRILWYNGKKELELDFDTADPEAGLQGEWRCKRREKEQNRDPDIKSDQ